MESYLPTRIKSFWVTTFFNLQAKSLYTQILYHHARLIEGLAQSQLSPLLRQFQSSDFWERLKSANNYSDESESLYDYWKKIAPYAHLTSKQLLVLMQDHLLPLECHYQHLIEILRSEIQKAQDDEIWRPQWFLHQQEKVMREIGVNLEAIKNLKLLLAGALLLRSKAHEALKQARNVDDVVAALAAKINGTHLLPQALVLPESLSATLNDDRRLLAYDLLLGLGISQIELQQKLIEPISWYGQGAFVSAANIRSRLNFVHQFGQQVLSDLDLGSIGEHLFFLQPKSKILTARIQRWKNNYFIQKITKRWQHLKGKTLSFVQGLWTLRHIIYFIATLTLYQYLIKTIEPLILIQFSVKTFHIVATGLFYSLGLAPLWWLGFLALKQVTSQAIKYLLQDKVQQIIDGLVALEETELFIANHLSQPLIDTPCFDSKQLTENIEKYQQRLHRMSDKLLHHRWYEKIFSRGVISQKIQDVRKKIQEQKERIHEISSEFAKHISLRVGEDIQRLTKAVDQNQMMPLLPTQQVDNLQQFVRKYGSRDAQEQFSENSNVVATWLSQFGKKDKISFQVDVPLFLNQPWGGYSIRSEALKGWQIILNAFTPAGKKEAVLNLSNILEGKGQITRQEFIRVVDQLATHNPAVLAHLQWYIFQTLTFRPSGHASLLSDQQIKLIADWYHLHEEEIENAKKLVNEVFSSPREPMEILNGLDDKTLVNCYELLDGADIYAAATGMEIIQRQNKARQFFEEYEGQHSRAYRFVKFVPELDRKDIIVKIAKKRLGWILAHLSNGLDASNPFDEVDIELFNNYSLLHEGDKFSFSQFVSHSEQYLGSHDGNMERFLSACQKKGLNSGGLLNRYRENNARVKPFILHQQQTTAKVHGDKAQKGKLFESATMKKKDSCRA